MTDKTAEEVAKGELSKLNSVWRIEPEERCKRLSAILTTYRKAILAEHIEKVEAIRDDNIGACKTCESRFEEHRKCGAWWADKIKRILKALKGES